VSLLSNIPDEVRDHLKMLLNVEPSLRPDTDQLSKVRSSHCYEISLVLHCVSPYPVIHNSEVKAIDRPHIC